MTYTARIRWTGPDPTFEIETAHPGFASPEEAALYANCIPPRSPALLSCGGEGVAFVDEEGNAIPIAPEQVAFLRLAASAWDKEIAEDSDFEPHVGPVPENAHGEYEPIQYAVMDAAGSPVHVSVEVDETGLLHVSREELPEGDEAPLTFLAAALPRC